MVAGLKKKRGPSQDKGWSPDGSATPPAQVSMPLSEHIRTARIISGLVLLYYVFVHLSNHALGNISLELMETVEPYSVGIFRRAAGSWLLGGAAAVHFSLALWAVYIKRRLRMPPWEAIQLILGFLIPLLLMKHFVAARVAREAFGAESDYSYVIWGMRSSDWNYLLQTLLLTVAWAHGCMGIHYWLRFRAWYPRVARALAAVALLLPVVALLGFLQAVREVSRLDADPRWHRAFTANAETIGADGAERLLELQMTLLTIFGTIGVALLGARLLRQAFERRRGVIQVVFPGNQVVAVRPGATVLEISRGAGLPHASVCGGRCRCSTCRVRVGVGADTLPPPAANEARVLQRIGAAPNVRLACQIRPTADVEVTPLFPVPPDMEDVRHMSEYQQGREMEIAVMFADLRGFTSAAEHQLPYDTVFLLNRYFKEMGIAIHDHGGVIDKFIGDCIMVLFGLDDDIVRGTTNALKAAQEMSIRLESLNHELRHDLKNPLKMGIGLHTGGVIVGEVGWGAARSLTAIGDTVNTASRIEGLTKRFECELLISADAANVVGGAFEDCKRAAVAIRGRSTPIEVIIVPQARDLKIVDPTL